MASRRVVAVATHAVLLLLFLLLLLGVATPYRLERPAFDSVRLLSAGVADGRLVFEARGHNLFPGLPVRVTHAAAARDTTCNDEDDPHAAAPFDLAEVSVSPDGTCATYALTRTKSDPDALDSAIYFCLPRVAVNANRFAGRQYDSDDGVAGEEIVAPAIRGDRWLHQGDAVVLDRLRAGLDTDPDDASARTIRRGRREETMPVPADVAAHVIGLRVDSAPKDPSLDEDGAPELLVGAAYVLRLFGTGFTEHTQVIFTQQTGEFGGNCLLPVTAMFPVMKESVRANSVRIAMLVPPVQKTALPLYVCIREGNTSQPSESALLSVPFVHQGSAAWQRLYVYEKAVPLWVAFIIIICCLTMSALFSGLNLGLMSLDRTELKILCNTGTEQEKRYAKTIQPVRNHGNFLLCSILLGNVLVNSTFTILLDDLTSGLIAVVCSTLAIVMFGEITPQAICSRHGLAVGARTIVITKIVMAITFPLSYPISRVLDVILGEEIGSVYTRERLKELVKVTTGENDLDKDEVNIISGALELRRKTVADVMTKIEDAFMLSYDAILDFETVSEIMKTGYSRIPVFENDRKNIVTTLYIKDLAFVDPDDNTPLKTLCQFYQNPCNFVFEDVTLDIMFKDFKEGNKGHMAFVNRVNTEGEGDPFYETIGLITLEDVIEELIQAEIMDETDVFTDNRTKRKRNADRTKQDFTVFAERRGESNRIRISPQLTLATFQYLSTSIDMFKPPVISETILRRLLKQNLYHHIKKNKDWRNDTSAIIYSQRVSCDYFVLILEGRVEVQVGEENLTFESGPFSYFGTQALTANMSVAESPTTIGSMQSLNVDGMQRHSFQPDYSVRACTEVLYLKLKRNLYLAAKRASLMEMTQRDSLTNGEGTFDDEVEKFYDENDDNFRLSFVLESDPETSTEPRQLLHSLEDDASIGRHSPELAKQAHQQRPYHPANEHTASGHVSPQMQSTRTPLIVSSGTLSGGGSSMRAFGSREINGAVKHATPTHEDAAGASGSGAGGGATSDKEEEEVSLLSKKT